VTETRKIAAILVADVVGYSRLAGTDEDRTVSRPRGPLPLDGHKRRPNVFGPEPILKGLRKARLPEQ
jgi:hypothetical protein